MRIRDASSDVCSSDLTSTANLFVEKDLYAYVRGDGSKDTALEEFFAQMEGDGAVFINSLAWIVRAGEVPVLTDTAWDFWNRFSFYYLKRTPGAIAPSREAMNLGPPPDPPLPTATRDLREAGGGASRRSAARRLAPPRPRTCTPPQPPPPHPHTPPPP